MIDKLFQKIKDLINITPPPPLKLRGGVPMSHRDEGDKKLMLDTTVCPYCASKNISASTLSGWIEEFKPHLPFLRMRDYAPIYPINQNDSKIKWEKFSQYEISN